MNLSRLGYRFSTNTATSRPSVFVGCQWDPWTNVRVTPTRVATIVIIDSLQNVWTERLE